MSKLFFVISFLIAVVAMEKVANAAGKSYSRASESYSRSSYGGDRMMMDLSYHYLRDTRADGPTDTAGRLSIGGMMGSLVGIDFVGMRAMRSTDYLIGGDLRLAPTDWFFLKAGAGAYADKLTREFKATPIGGVGIKANMSDSFYMVSEFTYFQHGNRNNISFGAGLGVLF